MAGNHGQDSLRTSSQSVLKLYNVLGAIMRNVLCGLWRLAQGPGPSGWVKVTVYRTAHVEYGITGTVVAR